MRDTGVLAQPPKFSVDDRQARFRYALKRDEWQAS